jgi:hypothetical protein
MLHPRIIHINSFTQDALRAWKSVVIGDIKLVFFLSRMCSSSLLSPPSLTLSLCLNLASSPLTISEIQYNNVKHAQYIL